MFYPNNIKKEVKKNISFANRGMDLEKLISDANNYYLSIDKAVIYKKPTPVKISSVTYKNDIPKVDGYLNQKSTLDYVGLYKGKGYCAFPQAAPWYHGAHHEPAGQGRQENIGGGIPYQPESGWLQLA